MRKSKDRQHDGQKKNNKRTNNDLQNTTQKTKDPATRTPLNIGGELIFHYKNIIGCLSPLSKIFKFFPIVLWFS